MCVYQHEHYADRIRVWSGDRVMFVELCGKDSEDVADVAFDERPTDDLVLFRVARAFRAALYEVCA